MKDCTKNKKWIIAKKKSIKTILEKKKRTVDTYYKSPILCEQCKSIISYEKRNNKFCSRSCAATKNNVFYPKKVSKYKNKKYFCKYCLKLINNKYWGERKYCSFKHFPYVEQENGISGWMTSNKDKLLMMMIREVLEENMRGLFTSDELSFAVLDHLYEIGWKSPDALPGFEKLTGSE